MSGAADLTWPDSVRRLVASVRQTLAAAAARDTDAFDETSAVLAAHERSQVEIVLGWTIRALLEEAHPDGLSGADAGDLLAQTARSALDWCDSLDAEAMIVVLTGSLGVHEVDPEQPSIGGRDFIRQASLLIAELVAHAGRPIEDYLHGAVAEIARAETMELP